MTAATIRASAAYRKRQAAKMQRYEAALLRIAEWPVLEMEIRTIARAALQEPSND